MQMRVSENSLGTKLFGDNLSDNPISLKHLFLNLQKEMETKLRVGRDCITHPTAKGDDSETHWRDWIDDYLPKRYSAEKAFVIDSIGNQSEQIDIVIYDKQYSPLIFKHSGAVYIPAESVYAVFEVKQTLNKSNIDYSKKKAASVRALYRTSAPIPHAGGTFEPRTPIHILAGILTYNSDWTPPLGDTFITAIQTPEKNEQLDLGCVICEGAFEVCYSNGQRRELYTTTSDRALVFFFLKLLSRLQSVGTVPAMDISEYIKSL